MSEINPDIKKIFSQLEKRSLNSALFNIADVYSQVGMMASDAIFFKKNADFAAPAIMCKSFSIELLLKFFIIASHPHIQSKADLDSSGVDLHGHRYSDLYDRINPCYQKEMAESFTAISGTKTDAVAFRQVLIDIGNEPFVYWRYIYEKSGLCDLDIALLDKLLLALGKAAENERKRSVTCNS